MNIHVLSIDEIVAHLATRTAALVVLVCTEESEHPRMYLAGNPVVVSGLIVSANQLTINAALNYLNDNDLVVTGNNILGLDTVEKTNDRSTETDEPDSEPTVGDADPNTGIRDLPST